MKKQVSILLFLLFSMTQMNAQTFKWAAQFGGIDYETGEDIAVDSSGNVYLVGIFNATSDFDPGPGTHNLTSAGAQDIYVLKLDSDRNFIWALRVGGSQQDFAYSIAVDGNAVYVCGNFRDTVDFNPGAGINNLISAGANDIFVLKLDTASNLLWAKQVGGIGKDVADKLTVDHAGNILVCGEFQNTVDFDPGAGIHNLISNGSADSYVLKLDSGGNYQWVGQFGNASGQLALGLTTDAVNDVYVTGEFYGTIDFDPGANVYNLNATGFNANIFVLKWSASGNFNWADNLGNSSGGDEGVAIKTDAANNPVITGSYTGTVDFDPGFGVYNITSVSASGDIFILKLTSSTGAFVFAKSIGGPGLDESYGLALNAAGHIYTTGFFSLTADFDPDTSAFNLTASGPGDIYICEMDASGNFLWATGIGGSDNDFARGIYAYGSDVYTSGVFAFTADFDPGFPVYNLSSFSNSSDAFLLKLRFCTPLQTVINYSLCPADSVFAGGAYQYNPGVFYDYYISVGGCDSIVTSTIQYSYVLNLGNDITTCSGQQVLLDANVSGATYLWSTGATTQTILVSNTNSYWVSVSLNGCVQQDTIGVNFTPLPVVNLGNDTLICINASVTLDAGAAFASWLWSDGSTGQTYSLNGSAGAGTYVVSVTVADSSGCLNSDSVSVIVSLCNGMEEFEGPGLRFEVFPNPANDFITIQSVEKIKQFALFNEKGEVIIQKNYFTGRNNVKFSTATISNGIYYIQIKSDTQIGKIKIVIQH